MKRVLSTLFLTLAIAVAGLSGAAFAASDAQVSEVAERFGFEKAYLANVDGMIVELRKMRAFSGSQNKDTEKLRIRLTRDRMVQQQDEILGTARKMMAENMSDEDLKHLLDNMGVDGRTEDVKANETKDVVVRVYRDATFNAIIASAVPVHELADKMKAAGEVIE
ncbi:hypothetical protein [Rhizobium sp.]